MHVRLRGEGDESEATMREYNRDSLQAIRRSCGDVKGIDVFDMTSRLVHAFPDEAQQMTHDACHWSRAVNILKAQIILYAFES